MWWVDWYLELFLLWGCILMEQLASLCLYTLVIMKEINTKGLLDLEEPFNIPPKVPFNTPLFYWMIR